jgi:hypothetical protein
LWINSHLSPKAQAADQEGNVYVAAGIREIMRAFEREGLQGGAPLQYRMLVELEDNLLRLAFRIDERGDPEAIKEVKAAHRAYLATFIGVPRETDPVTAEKRRTSGSGGRRRRVETAPQTPGK